MVTRAWSLRSFIAHPSGSSPTAKPSDSLGNDAHAGRYWIRRLLDGAGDGQQGQAVPAEGVSESIAHWMSRQGGGWEPSQYTRETPDARERAMAHRSLEELVEHQARRWEVSQRAAVRPHPQPCVALSRLPHSGAAELGRQLAAKLDYGFFGIEIVDRIAREEGLQRKLVAELDERARSAVERYVLDGIRGRRINESDYLRLVVRTIVTLGEQGMAVILGRGAPFVLGPERALRVLVVASAGARAERLARRKKLSTGEARARLAREDAQRLEFLSQFAVDPDDPSIYDLAVNTETLGIDAGVALVLEALRAHTARLEVRD